MACEFVYLLEVAFIDSGAKGYSIFKEASAAMEDVEIYEGKPIEWKDTGLNCWAKGDKASYSISAMPVHKAAIYNHSCVEIAKK